MSNLYSHIPKPKNEPVLNYTPGSREKDLLLSELDAQLHGEVEIPLLVGGQEIRTGNMGKCVCPHLHGHVLGEYHQASKVEVNQAISMALESKKEWERFPWHDRAAIFLKAADLITTKYRYILNASTMLNQSKNPYQAEIDSACELADFFRFNVYFMQQIYAQQPEYNAPFTWNQLEYRPLEGFVFAVSPFNFTAITGNLVCAPALMGNVVLLKPASTAVLSAYYIMELLKEAGLPDGVINLLPGSGNELGEVVLNNQYLAGIHFTGSTGVFNKMWNTVGNNISQYRTYPRLVGETGGKDFVMVHPSADVNALAVALTRGAFEYQGQKCSAASRAYVPQSMWPKLRQAIEPMIEDIIKNQTGNPEDFMFYNAVIDEKSFDQTINYIHQVKESSEAEIVFGGNGDKSVGYFIEPTVILTQNPKSITMQEELFAPVLTIFLYEDNAFEDTLALCNETSPYALTGAIFARDRQAINKAFESLRYAAGNFYINDKPTGAVVGQQPFGGSRKSGTNDKAGSGLNLLRWTSPRTIKENFAPDQSYGYPFMEI